MAELSLRQAEAIWRQASEVDTSHTHEYLVSGCRYQFASDHDGPDCWRNFMKFKKLPEDTTLDEFYGE
jgi:hypothetical protein